MQKTLYALLGVLPHASDAEIHAAYRKLSKEYESATSGQDPAERDLQAKILAEAFYTLSDVNRRAAYDASLIARALPPRLEVEIREPRWTPQKVLIMAIGTVFLIAMIIQIGFMLMSYRQSSLALSEAQVRQKEFEMTMGEGHSASDSESARVLAAERKAEQEARQRQQQEEREQRQRERELEESRRYAERVSSELVRGEEKARREAEYAQQKAEREEQHRKQEEERAIQRRLDDEKRRLRELEMQNRRNY